MTRAEFDTLAASAPEALYALFQAQAAQLAALTARVAQLEARVGGHSQNSHRPPSSDGPRTPPRSQRERSGKAPGGQPGHRGQTLTMVATPDTVVAHHPAACGQCGASLADMPAVAVARRQVVDLPPLTLAVTEHQAATVCCPRCRAQTVAAFPGQVAAPVQYGPRLLGLGVYLRHYQLLPYARIRETLRDLFGAGPACDTLAMAGAAAHAALAPVEAAIRDALAAALLAHTDETGIRVAGRREWVHVVSTARLTHYARHAKRGQIATAAIGLLPRLSGRLIHDGWASYWHYPGAHGLCNAHHLRELTAVAEQAGQGWAADLHALLRAMLRHVHQGRAAGRVASPPDECAAFVARYRAALAAGYAANPPPTRTPEGPQRGRLKRTPARNLLDRLSAHEDAVLAFLHDWTVPFDNNQAERDLRMLKVQQKISGTFRDAAGADVFCRLRGYLATLRKQGQPLLAALALTLAGQPPLPALLPG